MGSAGSAPHAPPLSSAWGSRDLRGGHTERKLVARRCEDSQANGTHPVPPRLNPVSPRSRRAPRELAARSVARQGRLQPDRTEPVETRCGLGA